MVIFYFYDELTSTIDQAQSLVKQGKIEEAVVVTEKQTSGRGRRGREWQSPSGNLYMTYIAPIDCPIAIAPQLSYVACVAVGEALRPLISPENTLTYKWPNDILLNMKKVSGILLEMIEFPNNKKNVSLMSCGFNIISQPTQIHYPVTSLHDEGIYLSYDEVLKSIVGSLQTYLDLWKKDGFLPIMKLWMMWAAHIDKQIKVDLQNVIYEGIFKGLNREGAMLLQTSEGLVKFSAGEVLMEDPHASRN